jgi:D-arabinose 1-dehydrogenase-like Zn-dependent alcohol dehydrogenase
VDSEAGDLGQALQELGGAKVLLATAPSAKAISALVPGLGVEGVVMVVGAAHEPLTISAIDLISADRRVQGWSSGTGIDSTDTMNFAQQHGIQPMIETFPLEEASAAIEHMKSGKVRFRSVLEIAGA